jgi:LysR family transcriptional activator of nhaA
MRHLNYNHLLYFWTVAREGSIARASEVLHLAPQTISGQLKLLERSVGDPLFDRVGRGLVLTEAGRFVFEYAEEIFSVGAELAQRVRGRQAGMPAILNVGVANSIPKLIAYRILRPALEVEDPVRVVCREGDLEQLLGELAVHRMDLLLSDRPTPTGLNVKAYNHLLGESSISFFVGRGSARKYLRRFPVSLDGAPLLLPVSTNALRRGLDDWFEEQGISPRIVAEFDDSALLKAFGEGGSGIFPAPTAIREEVESMYHAKCIGSADTVTERYYAISPERKLKHPAVVTITATARSRLFT